MNTIFNGTYRTIRLMLKNVCVDQCECIQALCRGKISQVTQYPDSVFNFLSHIIQGNVEKVRGITNELVKKIILEKKLRLM